MELKEQIAAGEGKTLEFKSQLPDGVKLTKTLIAFSNTSGGKLVIGVDDHCQVIGVETDSLHIVLDKISNMVHDHVHPMILPEIYTYNLNGKVIIIVEVFPSALKPHYLKAKGKLGGTYIRVGATNKLADNEYVQTLERERLNISFDEDIWHQGDYGRYNYDLEKVLSLNLNREVVQDDLVNLKLIRDVQGNSLYTNAVPILLGELDHVQIQCARFKGVSTDVFIDKKVFQGDLFVQLKYTMSYSDTYKP